MKAITNDDKTKLRASKKGNSKKNRRSDAVFRLAFLGLITAVMFIMAFTPRGYLKTGFLSITFMTIPVIIAAVVLTPLDAAVVGGIFGLTSFIQAVTGASLLTNALFQVNPLFTIILCFVPRVLEGLLGGLLFRAISRFDKTKLISYAAVSLAVPLMNTLFFMSTLFLLFYNSEPIRKIAESKGAEDVFTLLFAMVGINAVLEAVICFIIGTAITKALSVLIKKTKLR